MESELSGGMEMGNFRMIRNTLLTIIAALCILIAGRLAAAVVTIDGNAIDAARVEITTAATPDPEPDPEPDPDPEPEPEPEPTPSSVRIQPGIDWESPGARRVINIPSGLILSYPFRATNDPTYSGSAVISEVVGYELVTRRMWVSVSPGGTPLSPVYRCAAEGVSAQNIKWSQQANRFRCSLTPGRSYYLNITNTNGCPGTCQAYLSFLRSQ